ncbi:unnamed protein product [Camellia sinensis]
MCSWDKLGSSILAGLCMTFDFLEKFLMRMYCEHRLEMHQSEYQIYPTKRETSLGDRFVKGREGHKRTKNGSGAIHIIKCLRKSINIIPIAVTRFFIMDLKGTGNMRMHAPGRHRQDLLDSSFAVINGTSCAIGLSKSMFEVNRGSINKDLLIDVSVLIKVSKSSRPVTKFTEDFDFMAMNEKFKKDEVWGHLGKSNKSHKEGDGNGTDEDDYQDEDNAELVKFEMKPNYNKDDFFDSLSCNALDHDSNNGRTRFSEQMKIDTEHLVIFQGTGVAEVVVGLGVVVVFEAHIMEGGAMATATATATATAMLGGVVAGGACQLVIPKIVCGSFQMFGLL